MPLGPKVPPLLRERIQNEFREMRLSDTHVTASMVQRKVEEGLRRHDPNSPAGWPGVSAVDKIIRNLRASELQSESDPDERPWSIMATSFADIPEDALPDITRAWGFSMLSQPFRPLTIREARWAARLRHFVPVGTGFRLFLQARLYAFAERTLQPSTHYPMTADDAHTLWSNDLSAIMLTHRGEDATRMLINEVLERVYADAPEGLKEERRQGFAELFEFDHMTEDQRNEERAKVWDAAAEMGIDGLSKAMKDDFRRTAGLD